MNVIISIWKINGKNGKKDMISAMKYTDKAHTHSCLDLMTQRKHIAFNWIPSRLVFQLIDMIKVNYTFIDSDGYANRIWNRKPIQSSKAQSSSLIFILQACTFNNSGCIHIKATTIIKLSNTGKYYILFETTIQFTMYRSLGIQIKKFFNLQIGMKKNLNKK